MRKRISPVFFKDFYKTDHRRQYPEGTTLVYSNFCPRSNKYAPGQSDKVVVFGTQYLTKEYLIDRWNEDFFHRDHDEIVSEYKSLMDRCLGPDAVSVEHISALHKLGYLPIEVKALPEGTLSPIGVPVLTIKNTLPEFFWITNFLETLISDVLWKPMTSATTAWQYRKEFERHAELTGSPKDFIGWQGHDFSMRGMSGIEDACMSGGAHLLSFNGTDTIPAIKWLEEYYNTEELIGGSVPATEHSIMSMGGNENEIDTFRRLITKTYPSGIISIVSDTWDFWKVITEYLPALKEEILARDGRVVIRPDSGDPADIICGADRHKDYPDGTKWTQAEWKGAYELLWDIFGGTINDKGYKVLNPKVGMIYGDSITLERQKDILARLEAKGFCASNLVLGIGSYTYSYVTRDCYGFALKATYGEINGVGKEIFKDPKTDTGMKKSAKGLLCVKDGVLKDQCTWEEEKTGDLQTIFYNGKLLKDESLSDIRKRLFNQ